MKDPIELIDALTHPNVTAFIHMLRHGEGTSGPEGYRTLYGGSLFDSYADHPRKKITAGKWTSTAAGAGQILERTWDGLVAQYGFADFYPKTQDMAIVALIKGRKALDDVIAGRFETAVMKCNKEWASLPGSPYGQPVVTMARARQEYEARGGTYEDAPPMPLIPPNPLVHLGPEPLEKPMTPFLFAVLPALIDLIPKLGGLFASGSETSQRNVKAAEIVVSAAKAAIGAKNEQELLESIQSDPAAAEAVRAAVEAVWYKIDEVGGGIQAARTANEKSATVGSPGFWEQPAIWVTVFLLPLVYFVVYKVLTGEQFGSEVQSMVIAAVISGILGSITGFWLGTSFSSQKKTDLMTR